MSTSFAGDDRQLNSGSVRLFDPNPVIDKVLHQGA